MPRPGKTAEFARWLDQHRPQRIGELEFAELRSALAPVSESYLRKLVRECGVPLHPMVEGVRQATLDELEASLRQLLEEYEPGDPGRRRDVRRLVITAKDHARLAGRNPARRADKDEMVLWLTTWLENPPLFPDWVAVRRDAPSAVPLARLAPPVYTSVLASVVHDPRQSVAPDPVAQQFAAG